MWLKWTHKQARDRPLFWWRQLESAPRSGLPFAHLFPRPPTARQPAPSESRRLVDELVSTDPPERMEEIVEAYQHKPPQRRWDPVESWQILSVSRVDDSESAVWGDDGGRVVEWFDQGELMSAWPTAAVPKMDLIPEPRGIARVMAWFKGLLPQRDSLELANAEY